MAGNTIGRNDNGFRPTQQVVDEAVRNSRQGKGQTASSKDFSTDKQPVIYTLAQLDGAIKGINARIQSLSELQDSQATTQREELQRDIKILEEKRKTAQLQQEKPVEFMTKQVENLTKVASDLQPKSLVLTG